MIDCTEPYQFCPSESAMHVTSYHFERGAGYNENNAGLGFKWRRAHGRLFVSLGTFRNSVDHNSVYGGAGGDWRIAGPLRLRLTAGVVTGYPVSPAPFLFPELLIGRQTGIAVGYLPDLRMGEQSVAAFVSLTLFRNF